MSHYKGDSSEGDRARSLLKARENFKDEMENKKKEREDANNTTTRKMDSKFAASEVKAQGTQLKYGLVTLDEMMAAENNAEAEKNKRISEKMAGKDLDDQLDNKRKKKKKKQAKLTLSFDVDADDDDDVEDIISPKRLKTKKNPEVDTSFLPDRERDKKEREERDRLQAEWTGVQAKLKSEPIEITYSYWDGSGHRRTIEMKKGNTIENFLQGCLADLRSEFHELRGVTVEGLIYVKEDLLIPHGFSFYDFIVTKARGKSGPLFSFDVHDDVRMLQDVTVEKDESHAGKVILRSWYERNKHIFPASRWEVYDPEKKWDKYTIADSEKDFGINCW